MSLHSVALFTFFVCTAVVAWVYFGYPLALALGLFGPAKRFIRRSITPTVSIIVPAHNEEAGIEAKIQNLLALDYPHEKVKILVGSDGSSDRTQQIVERFEKDGVGLVSFPQQRGKSAIQNGLVSLASGEILVFTDADCLLPHDALRSLLENFADSGVGLVTAHPKYLNETETSVARNEGVYLRYETWLRKQESGRGLLAMASGSLFALRRSLWRPLNCNLGDDFVLPLRAAHSGMWNVIDERIAVCTRLSQDQPATMLNLKVRVISKDLRALIANRALLNPFRCGALSVALWSHKLLRWFVSYFLLAMLASNCLLLNSRLFRLTLAMQIAFYSLAIVGFAFRNSAPRLPWSVPMSFCLVNAAAFLGTLRCASGHNAGIWVPDRRSGSAAVAFDSEDLLDELT